MYIRAIRGLLAVALLVALPSASLLAADPQDVVIKDPDFLVQGEYVGEVNKPDGKKKFGVQVIALGKGKFHAVWRDGGLPGDGWDKAEATPHDGETVEGVTTFKAGEYTAKIKDDVMGGTAQGNVAIGELKRIVRKSSTLGAKPPKDAVVLFDGKNADQFENGRMTDDGLLMQGATSKFKNQSGTLHIEFQIPYGPLLPSRSNSGCYVPSLALSSGITLTIILVPCKQSSTNADFAIGPTAPIFLFASNKTSRQRWSFPKSR